jgi:hypothetical protein
LLTRCSSLASTPSRSLAVRAGWSWLSSESSWLSLWIAGCCALAASGHAVAAPPISVMNSRRLMSDTGRPRPGVNTNGRFDEPATGRTAGPWGRPESLAGRAPRRGGDSAVAEPSHVRRLACEHAGLSGRGRSRVTCNGGADSDRGPPFQLTLHVTAGHRSAGTSRRRSVLEASDLRVEQARFLVLFPRNVERDLVADENRRDLRRFHAGGWLHNSHDTSVTV